MTVMKFWRFIGELNVTSNNGPIGMSLPLPCYLNMSELIEAVKQLGVITQTLLVQEVPQVSHN